MREKRRVYRFRVPDKWKCTWKFDGRILYYDDENDELYCSHRNFTIIILRTHRTTHRAYDKTLKKFIMSNIIYLFVNHSQHEWISAKHCASKVYVLQNFCFIAVGIVRDLKPCSILVRHVTRVHSITRLYYDCSEYYPGVARRILVMAWTSGVCCRCCCEIAIIIFCKCASDRQEYFKPRCVQVKRTKAHPDYRIDKQYSNRYTARKTYTDIITL